MAKWREQNILQQRFHAEEPNQVWISDVTAFKFKECYYYICAILDLFSSKAIAYRVSNKNSTQLITFTFRKAIDERMPNPGLIFHSGRGTQYTSFAFGKLLQEQQAVQSFSRSGRPHDNAVMESFFFYLKKEDLYRHRYSSDKEFLKGIDNYMAFYNNRRPTALYTTKRRMQPKRPFIPDLETKIYQHKWVRIA